MVVRTLFIKPVLAKAGNESAFESHTYRPHGWAERGRKIFADVTGKREKKTNLIMGQRGKEWLAPLLFKGMCAAVTVETWIKKSLLKELRKPSVIVMDNAPVHNKKEIRKILKKDGHVLLPLPPYSPDYNPIEQTFGTLKKRRQFLPIDTSLDNLFVSDF
jgi:hypothetical protein